MPFGNAGDEVGAAGQGQRGREAADDGGDRPFQPECIQGFIDRPTTTCAESIYYNYQSVYYVDEVRLRDGGYADWYNYGYALGTGYWTGEEVTALSFLTAASCVWF